jgi:hypothetical protein
VRVRHRARVRAEDRDRLIAHLPPVAR